MEIILSKPVKDFLDAADLVLNSNTFLLTFQLLSANTKEELSAFIRSPKFFEQIVKQDVERGWHNMYNYDYDADSYRLRPGKLVKKEFDLKFQEKFVSADEYLVAMLTADNKIGNFRSYYNQQKNPDEAVLLVNEFISYLGSGKDLAYYIIEPDFLVRGGEDSNPNPDDICYFEGLRASDSATLFVSGHNAYLLLTNGIP